MVTVFKDVSIPGVEVIPCRLNGPRGIVKTFLLHDDESLVLIDTGFNDADGEIIAERIRKLGRQPSDLTHCIITHYHGDHTGGLKTLRSMGDFSVVSHDLEAAAIKDGCGIEPDRLVRDGEVLPAFGGLRVAHTPGHSPGHISVYIPRVKALATGDAIFSAGEWLVPPPTNLCDDPEQAKESIKTLLASGIEIKTLLVAHGEDIYETAKAQLDVMFVPRRQM